jgi:hypothetical protein
LASSPVIEDGELPASVFQSDLPIDEKLDRAQTELLGLDNLPANSNEDGPGNPTLSGPPSQ